MGSGVSCHSVDVFPAERLPSSQKRDTRFQRQQGTSRKLTRDERPSKSAPDAEGHKGKGEMVERRVEMEDEPTNCSWCNSARSSKGFDSHEFTQGRLSSASCEPNEPLLQSVIFNAGVAKEGILRDDEREPRKIEEKEAEFLSAFPGENFAMPSNMKASDDGGRCNDISTNLDEDEDEEGGTQEQDEKCISVNEDGTLASFQQMVKETSEMDEATMQEERESSMNEGNSPFPEEESNWTATTRRVGVNGERGSPRQVERCIDCNSILDGDDISVDETSLAVNLRSESICTACRSGDDFDDISISAPDEDFRFSILMMLH